MNNRGSVLFISILVVAAVSVIAATVVFSRSQGLAKAGNSYRLQVENDQVAHELTVIFANPKLCEDLIVISGQTFKIAGIYSPPADGTKPIALKTNPSVGIKKMLVENISTVSGTGNTTVKQADFSIVTQDLRVKNGSVKKNTVTAMYIPDPSGSGVITACRIKLDSPAACAELGFAWNDSAKRCQICEKMGGTWGANGACSLVSASGQ